MKTLFRNTVFSINILLYLLLTSDGKCQHDPFYTRDMYQEAAFSSPSELPDFKPYTQTLDINTIKVNTISANELKVLLDYNAKIMVVDCRSEFEFDTSHIKGAKWIGYDRFNPQRVWMYDRMTTVVICSSEPKKSLHIAAYLKIMGFIDVRILNGSLIGWVNSGYPIVNKHNQTTDMVAVVSRSDVKELKRGRAIFAK